MWVADSVIHDVLVVAKGLVLFNQSLKWSLICRRLIAQLLPDCGSPLLKRWAAMGLIVGGPLLDLLICVVVLGYIDSLRYAMLLHECCGIGLFCEEVIQSWDVVWCALSLQSLLSNQKAGSKVLSLLFNPAAWLMKCIGWLC